MLRGQLSQLQISNHIVLAPAQVPQSHRFCNLWSFRLEKSLFLDVILFFKRRKRWPKHRTFMKWTDNSLVHADDQSTSNEKRNLQENCCTVCSFTQKQQPNKLFRSSGRWDSGQRWGRPAWRHRQAGVGTCSGPQPWQPFPRHIPAGAASSIRPNWKLFCLPLQVGLFPFKWISDYKINKEWNSLWDKCFSCMPVSPTW